MASLGSQWIFLERPNTLRHTHLAFSFPATWRETSSHPKFKIRFQTILRLNSSPTWNQKSFPKKYKSRYAPTFLLGEDINIQVEPPAWIASFFFCSEAFNKAVAFSRLKNGGKCGKSTRESTQVVLLCRCTKHTCRLTCAILSNCSWIPFHLYPEFPMIP